MVNLPLTAEYLGFFLFPLFLTSRTGAIDASQTLQYKMLPLFVGKIVYAHLFTLQSFFPKSSTSPISLNREAIRSSIDANSLCERLLVMMVCFISL